MTMQKDVFLVPKGLWEITWINYFLKNVEINILFSIMFRVNRFTDFSLQQQQMEGVQMLLGVKQG